MRYVHWLKIDGYSSIQNTAKQFFAIEAYLKKYPKASALQYEYDSGSYRKNSAENSTFLTVV